MNYVKELGKENKDYRVRTVDELRSHTLWKDMEGTYCVSGEYWEGLERKTGLTYLGDCYGCDPLFVTDTYNYELIPVERIELRCDLKEQT